MINITLQTNLSEKNKITKEITDIMNISGTFKEETSISDPVIMISGLTLEQINAVNYMSIAEFGRRYFVTGIKVVRNDLVEISAHVDVLSSFSEQIKANSAIIRRQSNSPNWNLYLNDGSLHTYQNPKIITQPFPAGFTNISLIFAVAGG